MDSQNPETNSGDYGIRTSCWYPMAADVEFNPLIVDYENPFADLIEKHFWELLLKSSLPNGGDMASGPVSQLITGRKLPR